MCAQVRVNFVLAKGRSSDFILSPGGGLSGHVKRDTTQAASSAGQSRDKVLVLSNMDVGAAQLHLLMEAALAGRQEAAPPNRHVAVSLAPGGNTNISTNPTTKDSKKTSQNDSPNTSLKFVQSLRTAAKSIESLAVSKLNTDGQRTFDSKDTIQSIELNQVCTCVYVECHTTY